MKQHYQPTPQYVWEIAQELGITSQAVAHTASTLGLKMTKYDRRLRLSELDAAYLMATIMDRTVTSDLSHWMTADEAVRALGITYKAFQLRRYAGTLNIEARRPRGQRHNAKRYNPEDVRREAARMPIAPRGRVRGSMTTAELVQLAGISTATLYGWRDLGAPVIRTTGVQSYWPLERLAAWLDANPALCYNPRLGRVRQQVAARVRAHLAQQSKGAA